MRSSLQKCHSLSGLSESADVGQILANLFCVLIISFFLPVFTQNAHAGFCWDLENTGSCEIHGNNGNDSKETRYGVIDDTSELTLSLENIRFRSDCHNPSSGCNGQDWSLRYLSINHVKPDGTSESIEPAKLDINVALNGSSKTRNNWRPNSNTISGESDELFRDGISGVVSMVFSLPKGQVKQLGAGLHKIEIKIRGRDREDATVNRDLTYTLIFEIEENVRVKISGLDPFNLKTFPDHEPYVDQNVCVYASADNKEGVNFKIQASSGNGGTSFYLKNTNNPTAPTITYKPRFAQGVSVPRTDGAVFDLDGSLQDKGLTGNADENCNGGSNMTLFVEVVTSFESLSTMPAGQYTDVLTLTVSAD